MAEESTAFKSIAEAVGTQLNLPVESISPEQAGRQFGWFAHFAGPDIPASSKITQESLDWHPAQPTLLADLEKGIYSDSIS